MMTRMLEVADPARVTTRILPRNRTAPVRRAVIDQEQLPRVIGLSQHALDCFLDERLGVEENHYGRNQRSRLEWLLIEDLAVLAAHGRERMTRGHETIRPLSHLIALLRVSGVEEIGHGHTSALESARLVQTTRHTIDNDLVNSSHVRRNHA